MRLKAAIVALVIGITVPASAQQTGGGMIGGTLGITSYGRALDFSAALRGTAYAPASQFQFYPDPGLRRSVTQNVLSEIARSDKKLAAALGKDPFAAFGPALAAHDIHDNQFDDALTFVMLALWDAANASDAETQPGQTAGVKQQARAILAAMGGRPIGISVQEASDQLYLSALMISVLAAKVMERRDPSQIAELQSMARRESMASFGVDFARMNLDSRGLTPR